MEAQSEWVTRRPAPRLAAYVERYIGYRLTGFMAGVHRGLPSRHLTMIVSVGPEIDVIAHTDAAQAPSRYRSVLGGLQASPALISHSGDQEGVAIELTPIGCRALLGMPSAELWNTSLELDEVIGAAGSELWERLQGVAAWDARFGTCDDVLGRLVGDDSLEPALRRSWQLLVASDRTLPIAQLAGTIGWTRQHLARRFTDEFGLAPKLAARVVRFERARRMLPTPRATIAQVAASCGYSDQAHMTRDFTELAGSPPARLLADLPSVQTRPTSPRDHEGMSTQTQPTSVWPILTYRDARAAVAFLVRAFGFEEGAVYASDDDPAVIQHAELRWPRGGGVMFGSAGKDDSPFGRRVPGNDSVYVVCDDPDALFARATAAGAEVVRGLSDADYGSRGFTVRDPEGNLWSFGTYAGA